MGLTDRVRDETKMIRQIKILPVASIDAEAKRAIGYHIHRTGAPLGQIPGDE